MNTLLVHSVSRSNVLPLTSRCNLSCEFCSHRYNPPGVRAVFFGQLSLNQVMELMDYLDSGKKIIIGESATRLCEGEPLTHPELPTIIRRLHKRFPRTPIQLTTNAARLHLHLAVLGEHARLELVVSLNSADPDKRQQLMGKHDARAALAAVAALAEHCIPWQASLVLMPERTGWEDIEATMAFASSCGANSIRLLLPGFSQLADPDLRVLARTEARARANLDRWRAQYSLPITLEPPLPANLGATIAGVFADSPAAILRAGDEILSINGRAPFSRVEAFYSMQEVANPRLHIKRDGIHMDVTLEKMQKSKSGAVLDYDLSPEDVDRALSMSAGQERVLLLTSVWAAPLWRLARPNWQIVPVTSGSFGGNIAAAGLLTLADYRQALAGQDLSAYACVLLPPVSFDHQGLDLWGEAVTDLARALPLPLSWR